MRGGLVALAVLTAVAAAGCDDGPRPDLVLKGTPPAAPYSGRLDVPTREIDESGPRALLLASGAAGRALECDGEIFDGSGPDGWSRSDGGATPEEGLALYFDMFQPEEPDHGYRVERKERDRVLYSYDVDGRTKVAVVVARDQKDRPGWGPETSAACDPAELPESFTATTDWQIWTDRAGRRVPVSRLSSSAGPEHCGWQSASFLRLDDRTYARDPDGVLHRDGLLPKPYRAKVRMPAGAHDTGYHLRGRRLWLTDDRATAYVRTAAGVEAWPLLKEGVGCD
ncbi:hypothetical protein SAMN05428944_1193 [Streptomyces sp. 1222.5]|uniref:hypothetical protein n=1 Tax=unclassified Streptomyces TaxID=2593676 RepID=UPI000896AE94|nr:MULTISPECIES: hypothetical protein [unclassified Streptomyces]PKW11585.1 hypothetical protein BX260_6901 [Streptomyces sp. 5112.2]SEB75091.1 hypothetical protein SAMN05428944_1193 [Streptomyces sp. 1222.5]